MLFGEMKDRVADISLLDERNDPFRPKTEAELFDRIEHSLSQADQGMLIDADEAVDEVVSELGLR